MKLDEDGLQAADDAVMALYDPGALVGSDVVARAAVTAYLATANRLRPMSEAPHRGDSGRKYVLCYLDGDRKEPILAWRFGKTMVVDGDHYAFEELSGWLPLPEPVEMAK